MSRTRWRILTWISGASLIGIVVSGQWGSRPAETEGREMPRLASPIAAVPPISEQNPSSEPTPMPVAQTFAAMPAPIVLAKPDEPTWTAPAASSAPPEPTVASIPPPEPLNVAVVVNVDPPPVASQLPAEKLQVPLIPPPSSPPQTAEPPIPFSWQVHIEMVGNATQIELRQCADAIFRVQCDALEFSTPAGVVNARGKVHVTWSSFQADCEKATMNLATGAVRLEGDVRILSAELQSPPSMSTESLAFTVDASMCPIDDANGKKPLLPTAK